MQKVEVHSVMPGDSSRHGLAGWLLGLWKSRAMLRDGRARRLQLLETLPVGGKRQLMLVRCGDQHFMVGAGAESISAIVKVSGGESGLCQ